MPRYFFNLRNGLGGYVDPEGIDLPSEDAAKEHAHRVAAELIKNREPQARHWRIEVRDGEEQKLCEIPLIAHDRTLSHLSPQHREALERLSNSCNALREVIAQAHAVRLEARALVAKSRGRLYLAARYGEEILRRL